MAAASAAPTTGESALEQKLKESETISWYMGKCTLNDDVVRINPKNPNDPATFEGKVRACINRVSRVSFDGHIKPVLDCVKKEADGNDDVRQDLFQRRLVLACFLAESDDAAEEHANGKLKKTYLIDDPRKVESVVKTWIDEPGGILKTATENGEAWAYPPKLRDTLSGLIKHIEQEAAPGKEG